MSAHELVPFDAMAWAEGNHPLESKKVGGAGLTLLRFEPGFSDPTWCERSHVFFVTHGTLEIELQDARLRVAAGQALWLEAGTRHRASVAGGDAVVVFVASDVRVQDARRSAHQESGPISE